MENIQKKVVSQDTSKKRKICFTAVKYDKLKYAFYFISIQYLVYKYIININTRTLKSHFENVKTLLVKRLPSHTV
jgi:hypothetical protein